MTSNGLELAQCGVARDYVSPTQLAESFCLSLSFLRQSQIQNIGDARRIAQVLQLRTQARIAYSPHCVGGFVVISTFHNVMPFLLLVNESLPYNILAFLNLGFR